MGLLVPRPSPAQAGLPSRLWIARINAATREHDLSYSRFIAGLKHAGVDLNRKALADLAIREPEAFAELAKLAKEHSH